MSDDQPLDPNRVPRLMPKPAHERTLDSIRKWANVGFPDSVSDDVELTIVVEICDRVFGVTLPTPRKPASNAVIAEAGPYEYDLAIPQAVVAALQEFMAVCRLEICKRIAQSAIAWVHEEYIDNPMYAYRYPVPSSAESAPASET